MTDNSKLIEDIKWLKDKTGDGLIFCKRALEKNNGDREAALKDLAADPRNSNVVSSHTDYGLVASFIHLDKIGALVSIGTETDFCAKTDEVKEFAKNLCIHICANPAAFCTQDLYEEPWVLDVTKTVKQVIGELSRKTGESISVTSYARIKV